MMVSFVALTILAAAPQSTDVGPVVRAIWLVQQYGTAEARNPASDERLKAAVSKAFTGDGVITLPELEGLLAPATFDRLAGPDAKLDPSEIQRALDGATPESRSRLAPKLREHADYLTTTFDQIDDKHHEAARALGHWIAANSEPGTPLHVIVICVGNTRRSLLCASMGNLAAAYHGLSDVHFHSGGTAPTALNLRTIAALKAVGFEIEPTGTGAERSAPNVANPIYRVSWGERFEALEFSKHYTNPSNPQSGFAALMVCSEVDEACPTVSGNAVRIVLPFSDPGIYDDGAYESAKYAERRDAIGRVLLSALLQARGELAGKATAGR